MNSLEVKNLKKYYGEKCAVSDVSFSIKSGSITALCGKIYKHKMHFEYT